MKVAYRWLADIIVVGVFVQAAAVASGFFGLAHNLDDGATITKDWDGNAGLGVHALVGFNVLPLLALAFLVVGLLAKFPESRKWAAIVFGAVVLQVVLAIIAFSAPVVGVLHGMNALVILGTAIMAGRKARAAIAAEAGAPGAATTAVA
jgi:hypothetical protein